MPRQYSTESEWMRECAKMSKHTPGPWEWARRAPPGSAYQATIYADCDGFKMVAMAFESEANARLISAAPDLLAELARLADLVAASGMPWTEFGPALRDARAAIRKATGE